MGTATAEYPNLKQQKIVQELMTNPVVRKLTFLLPFQILLEKEFDDFYEDQVHKAAGPVVFVSKTLGMLPAIWTEDENESECKSYFNLYTFVLFIGELLSSSS